MDQQIKESDGVVMGHYLKSRPTRLENGKIVTQMFFKMTKEYGLQSELFGMDEVIVHYPGGRLGEESLLVEGVPKFIPGEKVVLFIRSVDNRYWGMNLGFGTFKLVNYGKEAVLVNSLFPENRSVGQMKLDDFERKIKVIKGQNLRTVYLPEYPTNPDPRATLKRLPAHVDERKNRSIASKSITEENEGTMPSSNSYWLVVVLASLGGLFRILRPKGSKKSF